MAAIDLAAFMLRAASGEIAPPELSAALSAAGERVQVRAGQMVLATGTRSDDVYLVVSGQIRVTIFSAEGREVIMRDQAAGSFFGDLSALDGGPRSASIVAIANSLLLVVRGPAFRAAVTSSPAAAGWLMSHLAAQIRSLTERVLELSTLNVRSRLHCHLLRMCAFAGVRDNQSIIEPSPTHEVIATMIGSHREAVTRELSYLAGAGIVEQSRRRLEIKDVERLAGLVRQTAGEIA